MHTRCLRAGCDQRKQRSKDGTERWAPVPAHAPSLRHFKGDFKKPLKGLFLLFLSRQQRFSAESQPCLTYTDLRGTDRFGCTVVGSRKGHLRGLKVLWLAG